MSNQQLQNSSPGATIGKLIMDQRDAIGMALPRHMDTDRLARMAITCVRTTRNLHKADPVSVLGAVIQASQLGLEPGIHAHIVPFWNSKRNCFEAQFIPDYRGLAELARRSGQIERIEAHCVYQGDEFSYQYGLNPDCRHVPLADDHDPRRITHVYAVAWYASGNPQFHVMTRADVDAIRSRSKAGKDGPWVTDYDKMAIKTAIKQLCKQLPQSPNMMIALRADDIVEMGRSQGSTEVGANVLARQFDPDALLPATSDDDPPPAADTPPPQDHSAAVAEKVRAQTAKNRPQPRQAPPETKDPAPAKAEGDNGAQAPSEAPRQVEDEIESVLAGIAGASTAADAKKALADIPIGASTDEVETCKAALDKRLQEISQEASA